MDVPQGYRILGLSANASQEEVKRAFRTQAFELHPDLHPHDPDASDKFRRLNEAYVTVMHHMQARRADGATRKPRSGPQAASSEGGGPDGQRRAYRERTSREEVLRDILRDPFARQVFEDIYRTIRKKGGQATVLEQTPQGSSPARVRVTSGPHSGLVPAVKRWLRSQIDDEQAITLDPDLLKPGQTIRFQVSRRFSGPPATLEVTLPKDYVVGRPIRLKGMGRHIGPWKGDLYLRFLPR